MEKKKTSLCPLTTPECLKNLAYSECSINVFRVELIHLFFNSYQVPSVVRVSAKSLPHEQEEPGKLHVSRAFKMLRELRESQSFHCTRSWKGIAITSPVTAPTSHSFPLSSFYSRRTLSPMNKRLPFNPVVLNSTPPTKLCLGSHLAKR